MSKNKTPSGTYGQYCPLALAAELLCRRWTLLVLSRLIDGCETFTAIHQGVPKISPSLLSTRLDELEHAGLAMRKKQKGGRGYTYHVTEAGRGLEDVITQLAVWGQQWARDNELDDLDPAFLAWSMSLRMDVNRMPAGRTVIEFEFTGTPTDFRRFWLVSADGKLDMCLKHPGYDTDLKVQSDLRRFVECWRGFRDFRTELKASRIRLSGPREMKKAFPDWLLCSAFADIERRAPGRERRLGTRRQRSTV